MKKQSQETAKEVAMATKSKITIVADVPLHVGAQPHKKILVETHCSDALGVGI